MFASPILMSWAFLSQVSEFTRLRTRVSVTTSVSCTACHPLLTSLPSPALTGSLTLLGSSFMPRKEQPLTVTLRWWLQAKCWWVLTPPENSLTKLRRLHRIKKLILDSILVCISSWPYHKLYFIVTWIRGEKALSPQVPIKHSKFPDLNGYSQLPELFPDINWCHTWCW